MIIIKQKFESGKHNLNARKTVDHDPLTLAYNNFNLIKMKTKRNREKLIRQHLGLEELSQIEAGKIEGGRTKCKCKCKCDEPNTEEDPFDISL